MRKLLKRDIKYENCLLIVFSLFFIIVGIINIINGRNINGFTIVPTFVIEIPLIIIGFILIGIEILSLIVKKYDIKLVKRIAFLFSIILILYILIDFVILGIVRYYLEAISLTKRPTTEDDLMLRLCYLWHTRYKDILGGVFTTIWLSLAGTMVGLVLGLLFVSLRTLEVTSRDNELVSFIKKIARGFVEVYVTIFRGTPMMVQAIIIYYFLPGILSNVFGVELTIINKILNVQLAGLITVSLNTTAYLTEVLRGGIESLNKGQMEAARSLGMTRTQSMVHVIFPQGIKNSLPAICNEFIINIKDTSVLSVISVMDLFFIIDSINGKYANQDGIFIAAILYLVLTLGISKLLSSIERKMNLVVKPLPSCN